MAEISDEMYEQLRQILEEQSGKAYTFEETKEIDDELVEFFMVLMDFGNEYGPKQRSSEEPQ